MDDDLEDVLAGGVFPERLEVVEAALEAAGIEYVVEKMLICCNIIVGDKDAEVAREIIAACRPYDKT